MTHGSIGFHALILSAALAAAPAAAQGFGPPPGGHGHGAPGLRGGAGMVEHLATALDLTADQKSKIETIMESTNRGESMRATMDARHKLEATIHDISATDAQVQDAAAAVAALEAKQALELHKTAVLISGVLTADQRAKLAKLHDQHRGGGDGPPSDDGGF